MIANNPSTTYTIFLRQDRSPLERERTSQGRLGDVVHRRVPRLAAEEYVETFNHLMAKDGWRAELEEEDEEIENTEG